MWGSKKPKPKVCSGFPGDCSPDQEQALEQFRQMIKKQNNNILDPRWTDYYLLRFLRARKFDLKETDKMWKNFINWRIKNNIDNIQYYSFPELNQLRKCYPHGYHKVDKKYRPIYIQRAGFLNVDDVFKFTSPQRLLNYFSMSYEALIHKIFPACQQMKKRQTGQQGYLQQTLSILDLKDVKLSQTSKAYSFIKPVSQLGQNNYPQILGNMFIINAPFLFTGIWAVVKMWIDQKTKQKIKILGSNYKKQLLQYVDPQNLPSFIDGGKCFCNNGDCLSHNIGPWNPQGQQMFPYASGLKSRQGQLEQLKQKQIQKQKLIKQQMAQKKIQQQEKDKRIQKQQQQKLQKLNQKIQQLKVSQKLIKQQQQLVKRQTQN